MILARNLLGDYYGSAYEFDPDKNIDNIKKEIKRSEDPEWMGDVKYFEITDDTIMTFATAKWLVEGNLTKEALIPIYKDFVRRYPSSYGNGFATWGLSDSKKPYNSCGNGSAMRVSPVGWYAKSLDECLELARISAEVTHNHPEGIKGAQATAAVIFLQKQGETIDNICRYITRAFHYNLDRTYESMHKTYKFEGTCQKTVPEAIIIWRDEDNYFDAICKSIAMGGDADTLACICGGFYVNKFGEKHFPPIYESRAIKILGMLNNKEFIDINRRFDYLVPKFNRYSYHWIA